MKIAFNPSTVAALTSPPNNNDITFDLRGRNIFARGVKFQGTDTNTWRSIQINGTSIGTNILNIIGATASTKDGITSIVTRDTWRQIKINNVSIGTNTLDLRNGTNVTLVNNNGIVTISSTWRPVVDNLTSISKDQSLSANMGRYLKSLIDSTNSTISDKYALRDGSNATGRWRGGLACLDVRNSEKKPQDLNMGLDLYFYANNTNGLKDGGSYNGVFSFRQWSSKTDWSGGKAHQLGFTDNSHLWHRSSKDSGTWNEWQRIAYYNEIPTSLKNPYALTLQANGNTLATYDGSIARTVNFTYSNIGAASSSHLHDDRYVKKVGNLPTAAYDVIISPTSVSGTDYVDTGGGLHIKAHTGTQFQLWLHDTSNVWYKKTGTGNWIKMDAGHADTAGKLNNLFTVFGVSYDGSSTKTVIPQNFISQLGEGTSTITDYTMLITSYASNSGFADTNAVNVPYKRKAIHLWEYIKLKTDSLYSKTNHNHDGRYVHNYGNSEISGSSLNNNALFMTTSSGITKDWWHILQAAWNNEYRWNSQIAFPTQNRNGVYYRSGLNDNTKWGAWVKLLDVDNYASILDSRYYTESEINNKLSTKLDRVNLSTSSWNPRGYNLAADYHYNGGDVSFAESGGQMHISIDGKFWQNEGQYKVLDTSDLGGIYSNVNLQQYISNTDTAWYPIVWGGSSHRNTNSSTGQLYKSHDKLSWQTSSQTLYTTNLQTLGITFPNSGTSLRGIQGTVGDNDYWRIMGGATSSNNGYLEIATADDGTEPIYIRQYTGVFSSVKRTLTLLDANGFSYFPSYINIGGNENNNSSPDRVWGSNSSDSFLRSYRTSALRVAYSKYLSGISLTGGNNNNAGYRLIFQRTMGGWTINYGVWAIAFRHSGRGVLNIGFDTTNSDGSSYTYDIRFFGSITSKESTPFRAFYNTTTKVLRIYWHYYDYTSGDIALLRGNIEPSNGTWMTSLPSDVGNELTIVYNRVSYADDSDKVDGYHATDGRTFTGNINWGSWNDVWSDGTHSHPWYGFDHRYSNTGVYSTTLSDYFGMTLKTANTLQFAVGSSYFQFGDSVLKLYSDGSGNTERVYLQANIDGRTDNYDIASYGGEQRHSIVLNPRGGYVGIGVSSPSHKLHINNTMRIDHGGTAGIYLYSSSGESSFSMQANGGLRWVAGSYTNRYFIQDSGSGESFSILNNHNVGIGNTNPAYRLDVSGSARISSQLFLPINGNYQAILMGDDCWLGDCNIGNVIGLSGTSNANAGGIKFGKGGMYIGYNGSNHYASSTSVWNSFNADMVDGKHASDFASSSHNHDGRYAVSENYGGFTRTGRLPISGFYQSYESTSGGNAPWTSWMHLINCQHSNGNNNYALQIAASFYDNNTFKIRVTNGNVDNSWRNIIHSGNIGSQTVANAYHLYITGPNSWSNWYWYGQEGQPSWLWGSNDGTNMYVWNPSNFNVSTAQYLRSLGNRDCQIERNQNYGDLYTYNTYGDANAPSTYNSIIGFGRGTAGTVEIAGDWCNGNLSWRSLRDCCDNWYDWRTVIDTSNWSSYIPNANNYYWANVKISTSSNTQTQPSVNTIYANNWFRSQGNTGWYNESYGGGWFMQDTSWIRAWNDKGVYTTGQIYSGSSLRGGNTYIGASNEIWCDYDLHIQHNGRGNHNVLMCCGGATGKVGIGTSIPNYKLDVSGDGRFLGNLYSYKLNHPSEGSHLIIGDNTKEISIRSKNQPGLAALYLNQKISTNVYYTANQGFGIRPYYLSSLYSRPDITTIQGKSYKLLNVGDAVSAISCIIADKVSVISSITGVLIRFNPGDDGQIIMLKDLNNYGAGNGYFWVQPYNCNIIRSDNSNIYIANNAVSNAYDDGKSRFFIYAAQYNAWIEFCCG